MKFSNRHEVQEYLTSLTTQGVIVELGCGYGNGVIAMSRGNINRLPIYSIDPYLPYSDPLGGRYDEETKAVMLDNTRGFIFAHIQLSALVAVRRWREDIGLLWVDLSMPYDDLWPIVRAWDKFILPDGYLGITGLEYSQLGTRQIYDELAGNGYSKILPKQNLVAVLLKRAQ